MWEFAIILFANSKLILQQKGKYIANSWVIGVRWGSRAYIDQWINFNIKYKIFDGWDIHGQYNLVKMTRKLWQKAKNIQ